MISLIYAPDFFTFAFFLYTWIFLPFVQFKEAICKIVSFVVYPHGLPSNPHNYQEPICLIELPSMTFDELMAEQSQRCCSANADKNGRCLVEESCSICLAEFEKEEMVSKLPRCGHVFHMDCIDRWLDRDRYTCPLCRSLILHVDVASPCKTWRSAYIPS